MNSTRKNDIKYHSYSENCMFYGILICIINQLVQSNYITCDMYYKSLLIDILYPFSYLFFVLSLVYKIIYNNNYKKISYKNCYLKMKFYKSIMITSFMFYYLNIYIKYCDYYKTNMMLNFILIICNVIEIINIITNIYKYVYYNNILDIMGKNGLN